MLKIKGNEILAPSIRDSFDRRAVLLHNKVLLTLKLLGVDSNYILLPMEKMAQKKAPASVSWYFEGRNLKYSYALMPRFVENLYIIEKVLKLEVDKLLSEEITLDHFSHEFSEDDNLSDQLIEARKTLGVAIDERDLEVINKKYKDLAKKHHPDMSEGDHYFFQKINAAHKLIRKELS